MLEIKTNDAEAAAKIIVVGVGGAGNNAVPRRRYGGRTHRKRGASLYVHHTSNNGVFNLRQSALPMPGI